MKRSSWYHYSTHIVVVNTRVIAHGTYGAQFLQAWVIAGLHYFVVDEAVDARKFTLRFVAVIIIINNNTWIIHFRIQL